jgi:hypothetical protein
MKRLLAVAAVLAAVGVTASAALPLSAGANSDRRFVVAIRGDLTGDTTGAGSFVADGSISADGTFATTFAATQKPNNCFAVTADWTFTAADGSYTIHGAGRSCSSSPDDPRAISDFRFKITGGTGAYADLAGKGSATGVTDFDHGTFTTVFDGRARSAH